jgi:drug/metabolite transporter (DMT)-like permease
MQVPARCVAMKIEVVALAFTASGFTAVASVAQRRAAAAASADLQFNWRLVGYLLRRPVWFIGIACMICGFAFQVQALRSGTLSLVQPIIATELVLVFGIMAIHEGHRVRAHDWLSALGMVVGLGAFLAIARPAGGHAQSTGSTWVLAALSTIVLAGIATSFAYLPRKNGARPSSARQAALLGIAAAVGFGFVAAVTKELSSHLSQGPVGVFSNWSPYVLIVSGAAAMFFASNAFRVGSLAAVQPGLTIADPIVASVLGVVLFGERVDLSPAALAGEALALIVITVSVIFLSQSPLVQEDALPTPPREDSADQLLKTRWSLDLEV